MTASSGRASYLVVGGAGFVGGNLVRELLERDAERIVIIDNFLSSERWNVPVSPRIELFEGSIADDLILNGLRDEFDTVFHLATYHGNQSSIVDPIADHDNNLVTSLKLFERLTRFSRVRKVVYAASGCTLAPHTDGAAVPTREEGSVPLDLDTPYQISKIVGEFYAVYFYRQHGLPTVRARFQNVYGPGEILGAGHWRGTPATVWRNVIPTFVYRALRQLPLELENGGRASRDFIYVGDVVQGLLACAERGRDGDVYNLASGHETTIADLADLVNRLTDSRAPVTIVDEREWDRSGRRYGSPQKAKRELGFAAEVPLEAGLRRTIAWTRENLELIDRCVDRHAEELEAYSRRNEPASI